MSVQVSHILHVLCMLAILQLCTVHCNVIISISVEPQREQRDTFVPFTLHEGRVPGAVGVANYSDETHENGWAYLEVEMSGTERGNIIAYGAGVLEGAVTHEIIYNRWEGAVTHEIIYNRWEGDVAHEIIYNR